MRDDGRVVKHVFETDMPKAFDAELIDTYAALVSYVVQHVSENPAAKEVSQLS